MPRKADPSPVLRIRKGSPPDIARVVRDSDAAAWNVAVIVDKYEITLAALDKDHASTLCEVINDAVWVECRPVDRSRDNVTPTDRHDS